MTRKLVKDDGPLTARILLVGEAPGEKEVKYGRPFVGPSGKRIGGWWSKVGLYRADFRITNTVPWRLDATKHVSKEDWQSCVGKLKELIDRMPNLELIVPTGALALKAFQPQKKITKVRGSEIPYVDGNGRKLTVVPTLHPAATFHMPQMLPVCERDWEKIARLLRGETGERPDLTHYIPQFAFGLELPEKRCVRDDGSALKELLEYARDPKMVMSVDIENTRGPDARIWCVGFSVEPSWSFVFPTYEKDYGDSSLLRHAWIQIALLCESDCEKVLQMGWTDLYKLRFLNGVEVNNYVWDLLCMHATLEPLAPHSLAHMASVYTEHPYWKDMTGVNRERDIQYNGIDNCVQREVFDELYGRLRKSRQLRFYRLHYGDMLRPLFETSAHGFRCDTRERKKEHARRMARVIEAQDTLEQLAGEPLHAKVGLSHVRVKRFLYETLGLPRQWTRAKRDAPRKLTTDQTALKRLRLRHANKHVDAAQAIDCILTAQRESKLTAFLADAIEDRDGRVRCEYALSNEDMDKGTGRLKSRKNPLGTGSNLQNIDREVRRIYKPDEGCLLVSADLCLAGDTKIARPWGGDVAIKDIQVGDPVWSHRRGYPTIGFVTAKQRNGSRPVVRVHFKEGTHHVICTPEHKFLVRRKNRTVAVQARYLRKNDAVIPFRRTRGVDGREVAYTRSAFQYTKTHVAVARAAFGRRPPGYDTHHKDENPLNNDPANLEYVPLRQHRKHHGEKSLARVNEQYRLQRLRAVCKGRDHRGKRNPHWGYRKGKTIRCCVCKTQVYDRPSRSRKYCSTTCYKNAQQAKRNHRVARVEPFGFASTYSITVEPDHNYALADAGVVVKNSQAEWRVFAMYSNDPELMELARLSPLEFDIHRYNGSIIYEISENDVDDDERYIAKHVAHAIDYGLQALHLSEYLLKVTGQVFPVEQCQKFISAYLDSTPGPRAYQRWVRETVREKRMLVNTWGRQLPFFGPVLTDDQYRQGYAFPPQSDVVDLLNQWGFIPMYYYLRNSGEGAVNLQLHDDVTWSCPPERVWPSIRFLHEQLERPRRYRGNECTIPVAFKIQSAWGVGHEFKTMPTRNEVGDVVHQIRKDVGI